MLLVDGAADGHDAIARLLESQGESRFRLEMSREFKAAAKAMVEQCHDVYLVARQLGERSGIDLIHAVRRAGVAPAIVLLLEESDPVHEQDGLGLEVSAVVVRDSIGARGLAQTLVQAIGHSRALRELEAREERYQLAAQAASDAVWDWDLQTQRLYVSAAWYSILGRSGEAGYLDPSAWFELVHPDDLLRLRAAIDTHLAGDSPRVECEYRMLAGDGSWRWVLMRGFAEPPEKGEATRITGWLSDVAERHAAEISLSYDALHDPLTKLPNRILFIDRLEHATGRARREPDVPCAVMLVDVDRFELINERLGHSLGDQLLRALAARVAGILRPGDTVARFGSDEFAVLLDGVDQEPQAWAVAGRIQSAVSQPFRVGGHEVLITARIGVALSSAGITAAELLRNADIATHDARRKGRGRVAVFHKSMHAPRYRSARREELRDLVEADRLAVYYQPIVDLASGRVRGLEALARWPEGSPPMSPLEFIALAEQAGLIGDLGLHVLRSSLEALARWRSAGLVSEDAVMSVNVSAGQLEDPLFASRIRAATAAAGVPGDLLRLEITEKTMMKGLTRVEAISHEVRDSGIVVHLDDFGTGESSLALLQRLPIEALKIDRSFISAMNGRGTSDAIVSSMIALGHGLGLQLIAEGIEQPAQLSRLRTLGCEYGQGYVFSRPLTQRATEEVLAGWVPADVVAAGDPELS